MKKDYRILACVLCMLAPFVICFSLLSCETPAGNYGPGAEKTNDMPSNRTYRVRTEYGSFRVHIVEIEGYEYVITNEGGICPLITNEKTDSLCN